MLRKVTKVLAFVIIELAIRIVSAIRVTCIEDVHEVELAIVFGDVQLTQELGDEACFS
jgi:hypothetical protein